jgi:hypothetical protein
MHMLGMAHALTLATTTCIDVWPLNTTVYDLTVVASTELFVLCIVLPVYGHVTTITCIFPWPTCGSLINEPHDA